MCNRHMFVQALATVVAVFAAVASMTVVVAAEVEPVVSAELAVSVVLAGAGEPVAEAEARIALEVSVVVGRTIGATQVVGS